jgi:uncharacterized damage-inducible protein DinB
MMKTIVSLVEAEFHRYKALGEAAIGQLDPEQLVEGSEADNSIETLVWHVSGNLESRFTDFLTSDGEKTWRYRDSEFEPRSASPDEIREKWDRGWGVLVATLSELQDSDLSRTVTIRNVALRVDEALFRSLAHTSYHVGQIVSAAKRFRGGSWTYLSIPPGGSAAYAANPVLKKATQHAESTRDGTE